MLKEIRKTQRRKILRTNRTRVKVGVHANRPRLVIHRSNKYIYAQIVDSVGQVLASASSLKAKGKTPVERAAIVGQTIAAAAQAKSITQVAFDRRGYKYHGQIKALADSAREGGLIF
ncbi:MAG: 50S ribosomal protein L18 [Patescibacteria group bacterium]|jgi:large subunit ribosomal protein L18